MEQFVLNDGSSNEENDEANEVPNNFVVSFNLMDINVFDISSFWESTEEETSTSD